MKEKREKERMTVQKNRIDPSPGVGLPLVGDSREATRHGRGFVGTREGALKGTRVPSDRRNSVVEGKSRLNRHALSPLVPAGCRLPPPLRWQRLHRAFHRVARFDETTEDVRRSCSQSCSDARPE